MFLTDLLGYVKRLLGVEGAIFNLKPIAEKIGTSEETMTQVMKSWRNENDQLELLMEPWLKNIGETKDLYNLRRSLEELKEEGQLASFFFCRKPEPVTHPTCE